MSSTLYCATQRMPGALKGGVSKVAGGREAERLGAVCVGECADFRVELTGPPSHLCPQLFLL